MSLNMILKYNQGQEFGEQFTSYSLSIDYDNYLLDHNFIDNDKYILNKISGLILGEICTDDISGEKDIIVKSGDIISKLQVKRIIKEFRFIDFSESQLEVEIKKILLSAKKRSENICIKISNNDKEIKVRYGEIKINKNIAKILGEQLILASQSKIDAEGVIINVN